MTYQIVPNYRGWTGRGAAAAPTVVGTTAAACRTSGGQALSRLRRTYCMIPPLR